MILFIRIILKSKHILLSLLLGILIINTMVINNYSGYYNEKIYSRYSKILAINTLSLIITTTTGDKNYQTNDLKNLYKNLNITHLLVLSGSNLGIFLLFVSLYKKRGNLINFLILFMYLFAYLCYVKFLHPLARALIFMTIAEFISTLGLKSSKVVFIFILLLVFAFTFYKLDYSMSFILSVLFSLLVLLYSSCTNFATVFSKISSTVLLFPLFMTFSSIPILLFFFKDVNLYRLLLSNILVVPYYDFLVFLMYLTVALSLLPGDLTFIIYFLSFPIDYLLHYLFFLNGFFNSYNI
jgi:hypothetical protein